MRISEENLRRIEDAFDNRQDRSNRQNVERHVRLVLRDDPSLLQPFSAERLSGGEDTFEGVVSQVYEWINRHMG